MVRKTEVSATTDPSIDTRSVPPPRAVRNHGRIFCRAAMRFPLGADRSSSKRVSTTELAAEDRVVTGSGLVCGIDGCAQPVAHPTISHAADVYLMVASQVA
jgi:hypothetical protein